MAKLSPKHLRPLQQSRRMGEDIRTPDRYARIWSLRGEQDWRMTGGSVTSRPSPSRRRGSSHRAIDSTPFPYHSSIILNSQHQTTPGKGIVVLRVNCAMGVSFAATMYTAPACICCSASSHQHGLSHTDCMYLRPRLSHP
jgi:hypothetical protein